VPPSLGETPVLHMLPQPFCAHLIPRVCVPRPHTQWTTAVGKGSPSVSEGKTPLHQMPEIIFWLIFKKEKKNHLQENRFCENIGQAPLPTLVASPCSPGATLGRWPCTRSSRGQLSPAHQGLSPGREPHCKPHSREGKTGPEGTPQDWQEAQNTDLQR